MASVRSDIETSSSLIRHAQRMDSTAWEQLSSLYAPVVYDWARVSGLQPADAAEIVQEVFHSLFANLNRYEHQSFRGWLWRVTRNAIHYHHRKKAKGPLVRGGSDFHDLMQSVPEEPEVAEEEPNASRTSQQLVERALELIRQDFNERTWNAFWLAAIEQRPYAEIAAQLEMREATVRQARYRVMQRLKEVLELFD